MSPDGADQLVNSPFQGSAAFPRWTDKIHWFEDDLEAYLGIPPSATPALKPLNAISALVSGRIHEDKIRKLKEKVVDIV